MLLDQFLTQTRRNCQVINLGAGFDSLFWLLKVTVATTTRFVECLFKNKFNQGFRFLYQWSLLKYKKLHVI